MSGHQLQHFGNLTLAQSPFVLIEHCGSFRLHLLMISILDQESSIKTLSMSMLKQQKFEQLVAIAQVLQKREKLMLQ